MKSEKSKFETNRMKSEKTMETQQNKIMTGHLPKYIDVFYPILIHIQSLVSVVVVIIAIFE
jgi:hypothetical protein